MAEYIERERIRKALVGACLMNQNCPMFIAAKIDQMIDCEPAADVAPAVRCKDCIFKDFPDEYDVCRCERTGEEIQSNDFCSHAVRKEQNND